MTLALEEDVMWAGTPQDNIAQDEWNGPGSVLALNGYCSAPVGEGEKMKRVIGMLIIIMLAASSSNGIDDKCAACTAVAGELENGLSTERPRNHLDMRHRLDSRGHRQGKLIDYRVSELRVVELLDGLCEKMQDYTLKIDTNTHKWFKVDDWDNLTSNKQEAKAYSKDISSYCGRLLEETEDELAELIKKGSVKVGGVSKVLCQDLSKHCRQTSVSHEAELDDEDNEEL